MKIVHLCLAGSYNDNWGYQDNLIPKYHKVEGHDVTVITSCLVNSTKSIGYEKVDAGEYILENGVKVIRIPFINFSINKIVEKLRIYKGVYEKLDSEKPDFIFIHGLQFLDIYKVTKYLKKNKGINVVVDNHADFFNSAKNWVSKNVLHKIIWKKCAHKINPYTQKFYGVLPTRVDFLIDMYDVPEEKVELLVLGGDDEKVIQARQKSVREFIRKKYGIKETDFLILTGGKIDFGKKQILNLMKAVNEINNENLKLLVFGSVIDDLKEEMNELTDGDKVQYIGWVSADETYNYFGAADLVVFPGGHSVFWEQVVSLGIPLMVKYWEGITHIDLGGNCIFLYEDSKQEIIKNIESIIVDSEKYREMLLIAKSSLRNQFLYSKIAKKSIALEDECYIEKD